MKLPILHPRHSNYRTWFVSLFALSISLSLSASAQPVPIAVRHVSNKVAVAWAAGLSLVQPQKNTNLATGTWLDVGAATTTTNFSETIAGAQAFYRLRFLPPAIMTQPLTQSAIAGGNVLLGVSATGTTPFTYQWQRNDTNLTGQTAPSLALTNVALGFSGDYRVIIANRAGAATSALATITVVAPAGVSRGIYMGKFAGQTNAGGFAILLRTNGTAVALGDSAPQGGPMFSTNVTVAPNGTFNATTENGGKLAGTFAGNTIVGTFTSTNGFAGAFEGTAKADTGIQQANTGFYSGTFGGLLTGTAYLILSADGSVFTFLSALNFGAGGAFGAIDAANTLSATTAFTLPGTTMPGVLAINGVLTPATHQFSGTYSFAGITLGTFSLTRTLTP